MTSVNLKVPTARASQPRFPMLHPATILHKLVASEQRTVPLEVDPIQLF